MLALLLVAQSLVAQAEEVRPADELAAQVTRLVRQLDDRQLARREAAEEALIELGPEVLDHLPPPDDQAAGEAAERLARVRLTLQQEQARRVTEATRVTLSGSYDLSAALEAMTEQTGNQIVDYRPRFGQQQTDVELELGLEDATFWTALDTVLDEAQLSLYPYAGQADTLAVFARPDGETDRLGRGIETGVFRLEGLRVEATRDLRQPDSSNLSLWLQLAWEPRVRPIVIMHPLEDVQAQDEDGNTIEVASVGTQELGVQSGSTAMEVPVYLSPPSRDARTVASLSGELRALVPGPVQTFEFDNLAEARDAQQRKAGAVVTLESARQNGGVYEVRMRVRFDEAANALESHRGWVYANEAYMLDPDDQLVQEAGFETTSQSPNEVGMSYKFILDGPPEGHTFVYRTPAALVEVPIEYELKDIPLP